MFHKTISSNNVSKENLKYNGESPLNSEYTCKKMKARNVKQFLLRMGSSGKWGSEHRGRRRVIWSVYFDKYIWLIYFYEN
jgi:hypothetical protein